MREVMTLAGRDQAVTHLNAERVGEARDALNAMGPALLNDGIALQLLALSLDPARERADIRALLERAARIDAGNSEAHFNLGVWLQRSDEFDQAILHYRHALRLQGDHLGALNNLSDLLRRRGQAEEGWDILARYQRNGGDTRGLELRYAKMAMDTRRFAEAEMWFRKAEAHAPGDAMVGWEHAMLTLAREDFARGWPQYECRLESYGAKRLGIHDYNLPLWDGEDLTDRRILLHREQGLGDMIMFAGLFDRVIGQAKETHIAVHPPLARLMAINFPGARVWSSATSVAIGVDPPQTWLKAAGPIDLQIPIGSLGRRLCTGGVPARRAYIKARPQDVAAWSQRLDHLAPRSQRRVGLVCGARRVDWSDDARTNGLRKSVPTTDLMGLSSTHGVSWISLHDREMAGVMSHIPGLDVIDCSPWIDDLADTAALIENLDVVVTVDTAVAHLAGAMGKPVHLMLWLNADWRWGLDRQDSYWYPNVTIHAQTRAGDWAPVVRRVVAALNRAPDISASSPRAQNGRLSTRPAGPKAGK